MIRTLAIAILLTLSTNMPASAAVRMFNFVARVDMPGTFVPVGTIINGRFPYDDAIVATSAGGRASGTWAEYDDRSINLTADIGGLSLSQRAIARTFDGPASAAASDETDSFSVLGKSGDAFFDLYIWQPDNLWLAGANLPASFPSSLWQGPLPNGDADDGVTEPHGEFSYFDQTRNRYLLAVVLSVTPSAAGAGPVPEPATWAMMILGFGMIGGACRMRRTRAVLTDPDRRAA